MATIWQGKNEGEKGGRGTGSIYTGRIPIKKKKKDKKEEEAVCQQGGSPLLLLGGTMAPFGNISQSLLL